MSSRIEQIIEEIEEYIDSCKFQPLSTTKIIVNKDQMDELLRELRMKTPDEIKRYQKIIANKDAILADAQAKADGMIQEAQIQTNELVSEHEIMQQAYAQANEIVTAATAQAQQILDNATNDANQIRVGAIHYTDDLLSQAESAIGRTLDTYTSKYDSLVILFRNVTTWYVTTEQSLMFRRRQNRMYSRSIRRINIRQKNIRRILMSRIRTDRMIIWMMEIHIRMICRFLIMIFRKTIHWIKIQSNSIYVSGDKKTGYQCGDQFCCYIGKNR